MTMAREHGCLQLRCEHCGATGTAKWSGNDGATFLRRGPETHMDMPSNFIHREREPDSPGAILPTDVFICTACGNTSDHVSVTYTDRKDG
jgi:hypothetical protein